MVLEHWPGNTVAKERNLGPDCQCGCPLCSWCPKGHLAVCLRCRIHYLAANRPGACPCSLHLPTSFSMWLRTLLVCPSKQWTGRMDVDSTK